MSFSPKRLMAVGATVLGAPVAGAAIQWVGTKVLPTWGQTPSNVEAATYVAFYTVADVAALELLVKYNSDPAVLAAAPVMLLSTQSNYISALQSLYSDLNINYN